MVVWLWIAIFAAFELAEGLLVALEGGLPDPVAGAGVVGLDALAGGVEDSAWPCSAARWKPAAAAGRLPALKSVTAWR